MAAPPAPVVGLASPADAIAAQADYPLVLRSGEQLVAMTPFLHWQPFVGADQAGPALVAIPHSRAAKAFVRRCSLSTAQADTTVFAATDCFQFFLNAGAWNRVLNELLASGLVGDAPFTAWPTFLAHLEVLQLQNANALMLTANDLELGDTFDDPGAPAVPAVPAQAARRDHPARAAVPAMDARPAVPGPAHLAFLSLFTVDLAVLPASTSPLSVWCDLLGALSPGRTRESRLTRLATVSTSGTMLKTAVSLRLMGAAGGAATDELIAVNLTDMLAEMKLPPCLAPLELNDLEIRAELRDSLRAARSDNDRLAVEVSRLSYTSLR